MTREELRELAYRIRLDILQMTVNAGANGGHVGGAFSCADILAVLYGDIMNVSSDHPTDPDRDRFILSKGHCAIAHYAVLKEMGFLSEQEMLTFEQSDGELPTHEVMDLQKGIETSSGSLGYGLSVGTGCALSAMLHKKDYKVFVLMGDGECNEGSVWEAAMAAKRFCLSNLIAIVDMNEQSLDGLTSETMPVSDMAQVWKGFGWNVIETDGNDIATLLKAFDLLSDEEPSVLIAHTKKGEGIPSIEGKTGWHHVRLTDEMYDEFRKEMEATR